MADAPTPPAKPAARPIPRRGRLRVIVALGLFLLALGYVIVEVSTREPGEASIEVDGIGDAQRIFGGIPQHGDRVGSADAPVTIQVFNDLQCSNCREDFLSTIPTLVEDYARPGDVKLLMRHYSNSINTEQLGFYGAEAAAEQGYGWQYTYLFFRNQDEAEKFGVDDEFLATIAGSVGEIETPEWELAKEEGEEPDSTIDRRLEGYEELGQELGIRVRQAAIVTGPSGTRTLQDGPSLAEIEQAIEEVE
ncbi:MAG TPA: thioredoxin domain-containing protein [Solirubrobacterales bacterium]|nr:thioredoxin domain-containing protein [Solirubrobacterales bacterium]